MKKQIVVTLGKDGGVVSFSDTHSFALYQKEKALWSIADAYEHTEQLSDAKTIRETVSKIAERYKDSRIIVSRKVSGVAYQMLDMTGFSIFEADNITDKLLDGILSDLTKSGVKQDAPPLEPQTVNNDGNYFFDLVRLQNAYPEISSKKALMGFITSADFLSLELVCDHLPPWMEDILNLRGYEYKRKSDGTGTVRYTIIKNSR